MQWNEADVLCKFKRVLRLWYRVPLDWSVRNAYVDHFWLWENWFFLFVSACFFCSQSHHNNNNTPIVDVNSARLILVMMGLGSIIFLIFISFSLFSHFFLVDGLFFVFLYTIHNTVINVQSNTTNINRWRSDRNSIQMCIHTWNIRNKIIKTENKCR